MGGHPEYKYDRILCLYEGRDWSDVGAEGEKWSSYCHEQVNCRL